MHFQKWQDLYRDLSDFRNKLNLKFNLPKKIEIHTKEFVLNKKPYTKFGLDDITRVAILDEYCAFLSSLNLQVINVAINKVIIKKSNYDILDTSFRYLIQRIENTLYHLNADSKFLLITDPGRIGKMRATSRRMQRVNYIPVKGSQGISYRREICRLIEDPLPKDSNQSYFIQIADLMAFITYHYVRYKFSIGNFPNRIPKMIDDQKIINWLRILNPILNLQASSSDQFGVVCYPR